MGGDNHQGRQSYRRFIIGGNKEGIESPLEIGKGHGIVGGSDAEIKEKIQKNKRPIKPSVKRKDLIP